MKNFKTYFDKIYCINYIESKERRDNIIGSLKSLKLFDGLEFYYSMPLHKINAISKNINDLVVTKPNYLNSEKGVSCALAHYSCIKTAYELGLDSILIMEDDLIFRNDRNIIIDYLENLPNDWEFINLDACINLRYIKTYFSTFLGILNSQEKWIDVKKLEYASSYANFINNKVNWMSSGCYAMKRPVMELYIEIFENQPHIMNSDILQYFFHDTKNAPFNYYIPNKRLVAQSQEANVVKKIEGKISVGYIYSGMVPTDFDIDSEHFIISKSVKSLITGN